MKQATQEQADAMIIDLMQQRVQYIAMVKSGSTAVMASILFIDAVLQEYVPDYVPDYSDLAQCTL